MVAAFELSDGHVLQLGQIRLWQEGPKELSFLQSRLSGAGGKAQQHDRIVGMSIREA